MDPIIILKATGLPVLIAAIAGLAALPRGWDESRPTYARTIGVVIVAIAAMAGQLWFLNGIDLPASFNAVEAWQWLLALMIPMACAGSVRLNSTETINLSTLLAVVLFHLFLQLALRPIAGTWEAVEKVVWMSSMMTFVVLWLAYHQPLGIKSGPRAFPFMLCIVTAISGVTFALQTSSKLGFLAAALSAALGPPAVYAMFGRTHLAYGSTRFVSWILPGFWLCHYFYSIDVPKYTIPLLALASIAPFIGLLKVFGGRPVWQKLLLQSVLVAACLAGALIPAIVAFESDPYSGY